MVRKTIVLCTLLHMLICQTVGQILTQSKYLPYSNAKYIVCGPEQSSRRLVDAETDQKCVVQLMDENETSGRQYEIRFKEVTGDGVKIIKTGMELCVLGRYTDFTAGTRELNWRIQDNPDSNFKVVADDRCNKDDPAGIWIPVVNSNTVVRLRNKLHQDYLLRFNQGNYVTLDKSSGSGAIPDAIELVLVGNPEYMVDYSIQGKDKLTPLGCSEDVSEQTDVGQVKCRVEHGDQQLSHIRFISPYDNELDGEIKDTDEVCIEFITVKQEVVLWSSNSLDNSDENIYGVSSACDTKNGKEKLFRITTTNQRVVKIFSVQKNKSIAMPSESGLALQMGAEAVAYNLLLSVKPDGYIGTRAPTENPTFFYNFAAPTAAPTPSEIKEKTCQLVNDKGTGVCRSTNNSHNEMKVLCEGGSGCVEYRSRQACENECLQRETCTAYEWDRDSYRCEVHFGTIDTFNQLSDRFCYACTGGEKPKQPNTEKSCGNVEGTNGTPGYCRSSSGFNDFRLACDDCGWTQLQCENECKSSSSCWGYEHDSATGRCEIHLGVVDRFEKSSGNTRTCKSCIGQVVERSCTKLTQGQTSGFCRSGNGSHDNFNRVCDGVSCSKTYGECQQLCMDTPQCTAFEIGKNGDEGYCEIHYGSIDRIAQDSDFECFTCSGRVNQSATSDLTFSGFALGLGSGCLLLGVSLVARRRFVRSSTDEIEEVQLLESKSVDEKEIIAESANPKFEQ